MSVTEIEICGRTIKFGVTDDGECLINGTDVREFLDSATTEEMIELLQWLKKRRAH